MNNETSYYSTSYILLADTSLVSNGAVSQKIKYFSLPSVAEIMTAIAEAAGDTFSAVPIDTSDAITNAATNDSPLNSVQESAILTGLGSTY